MYGLIMLREYLEEILGIEQQKQKLEKDGIIVNNYKVDL